MNGRYEFAKCEGCDGPLLGHQEVKCRDGVRYDSEVVKSFEHWLRRINGFREKVIARNKKQIEEMKVATVGVTPGGTTQLTKPRLPPLWTGQKFDRWRIEVERWCDNSKSMDEEKYIDLLESLKKNDALKGYVVNTLVEKVGETRTAKKILDVLLEKYPKNLGERTQDTMRMISGSSFKT